MYQTGEQAAWCLRSLVDVIPRDCYGIITLIDLWSGNFSMSEIAFHEKAGRSQVGSTVFSLDNVFLPPSRHCRHPSIRTLY